MSVFRLKECPIPSPHVPHDMFVEVRKQVPNDRGGFDVVFEDVLTSELCKDQLDPRLINLEYCISNNVTINPSDFGHILDFSDPNSVEELSSRISEQSFNYLKENMKDWDFDNNKPVKSSES